MCSCSRVAIFSPFLRCNYLTSTFLFNLMLSWRAFWSRHFFSFQLNVLFLLFLFCLCLFAFGRLRLMTLSSLVSHLFFSLSIYLFIFDMWSFFFTLSVSQSLLLFFLFPILFSSSFIPFSLFFTRTYLYCSKATESVFDQTTHTNTHIPQRI